MINAAWVLRNANLDDSGLLVDIALEAGKVKAMGEHLSIQGQEEWDLAGHVVLAAFVDAHAHLDQTLSMSFNKSGTLIEANEIWHEEKRRLTYERYLSRALQAQNMALALGTTALRSHVDIYSSGFWVALEAILDAKDKHRALMDIQVVALGRGSSPKQDEEALKQALKMGVDVVGGAPALSNNVDAYLNSLFDVAELYGKPLDLHVDEVDDGRVLTLENLADKTIERGFQGKVTAGHCCSLSFTDNATADRVMDKVKEAKINIVTLPSADLIHMGRGMNPAPRGITRVKELLGRGVNVALGSDKVRDSFNPLGTYDLLHNANLLAHTAHLTGLHELALPLEMIGTRAAEVMGLESYGLFEGSQADLVVLNAKTLIETLATVPERLAVFRKGNLAVHHEVKKVWTESSKPGFGFR